MMTYSVIWIRSPESGPNTPLPTGCDLRYLCPGQAFPAKTPGDYAAIVLDLPLPGWTAAELLEQAQRTYPDTPILIRDSHISVADAVRLAHLGASRFLTADQDLLVVLEQLIEEGRAKDLA